MSSVPVDQDVSGSGGGLASLAADLQALHLRAGRPSTRAVAANGLVSHDTVHRVLRCGLTRKVPRWASLARVVEALGGDPDQFRDGWTQAVLEGESQSGTPSSDAPAVAAGVGVHRGLELPRPLSQAVLDLLLDEGVQRSFPANIVLTRQGDEVDFVTVIVSGYVKKIYYSPAGGAGLRSVLVPGQITGHETALLGEGSRTFTLITATEVVGVQLSGPRFRRVIQRRPSVLEAVAADLARQLELQALLIQSQADPPSVRLANALLMLVRAAGSSLNEGEPRVELEIPLSQDELASLALVSRVTAQRVLHQFRERGVVELGYRRLAITDMGALLELAYPAALTQSQAW